MAAIGGRGHRIEQTMGKSAEPVAGTPAAQDTRPALATPAGELAAIRDLLLEALSAADLRRLFTFAAHPDPRPASLC